MLTAMPAGPAMDGAAMQIGRRMTDRAPAWLLTLPLLASLAGCMQPPPPAMANLPPLPPPNVQIVAPQPPPPARAETVPQAPPATMQYFYWDPGHWHWTGADWFWVAGHYVERPYTNAYWVPGHWDSRPYGWTWIPGYWAQTGGPS